MRKARHAQQTKVYLSLVRDPHGKGRQLNLASLRHLQHPCNGHDTAPAAFRRPTLSKALVRDSDHLCPRPITLG